MELSEENLLKLEELAPLNYLADDLAIIMGVDSDKFIIALNDPETDIYKYYKRGILKSAAAMDLKMLKQAEEGNFTAYQQYKKELFYNKLENSKREILLKFELTKAAQIQERFLERKRTSLDDDLEDEYDKLEFARRLIDRYKTKPFVINSLMQSFKLSEYKANKVYVDSINFFNIDFVISKDAWANVAAQKLENAAMICFEINDFKNFDKLMNSAATFRKIFEEEKETIDKSLLGKPFTVYVNDTSHFGLPKANRKKLASFIDQLNDISDDDRRRLHREALTENSTIFDVNFEDIPYANKQTEE